jgi:hypothetical protein
MIMKGLVLVTALSTVAVSGLAGVGLAGTQEKCGNPATTPLGDIFGASRGTTWCNDGATATAKLAGKTYFFKGGVCYRDSDGFHVGIGTSIEGKRKKSDPPGFAINDFPPGGFVKDGAFFGLTKAGKVISWGFGDVKLKVTKTAAPKGSFSGVQPTLVAGTLERIPASGTFACKRVLKVPG